MTTFSFPIHRDGPVVPRPTRSVLLGVDLLALCLALTAAAGHHALTGGPQIDRSLELLAPLAVAAVWLLAIDRFGGYRVTDDTRLERLVLVVSSGLAAVVAWAARAVTDLPASPASWGVALVGGTLLLLTGRASVHRLAQHAA